MTVTFDYNICPINALKVKTGLNAKKKNKAKLIILPDGREVEPTNRFWKSFQMRFRISDTIFKYYTYEEIFTRISDVATSDSIRYCIENIANQPSRILGITNPVKPIIKFPSLVSLLKTYAYEDVKYSDGFVSSRHSTRINSDFSIEGDDFSPKYMVDTPVDGFGRPCIYLGLLRHICTNGLIALSPAFRSDISMGKNDDSVEFSLGRALEGFNNPDGYDALKDRLEMSQKSWASVSECKRVIDCVVKNYGRGELKMDRLIIGNSELDEMPVLRSFMKLTGDLNDVYGTTNLDAIPKKRQRTLPSKARVYDLLNFSSEVATKQAKPRAARDLSALIGDFVSEEYDLEGTVDKFADWTDMFLGRQETTEAVKEQNESILFGLN